MEGWSPYTLRCNCHDLDVCPEYEYLCSEIETKEWWDSLTDEEKESMRVSICNRCYHGFTDNPGKQVCKACEDWVSVEEEYGINF